MYIGPCDLAEQLPRICKKCRAAGVNSIKMYVIFNPNRWLHFWLVFIFSFGFVKAQSISSSVNPVNSKLSWHVIVPKTNDHWIWVKAVDSTGYEIFPRRYSQGPIDLWFEPQPGTAQGTLLTVTYGEFYGGSGQSDDPWNDLKTMRGPLGNAPTKGIEFDMTNHSTHDWFFTFKWGSAEDNFQISPSTTGSTVAFTTYRDDQLRPDGILVTAHQIVTSTNGSVQVTAVGALSFGVFLPARCAIKGLDGHYPSILLDIGVEPIAPLPLTPTPNPITNPNPDPYPLTPIPVTPTPLPLPPIPVFNNIPAPNSVAPTTIDNAAIVGAIDNLNTQQAARAAKQLDEDTKNAQAIIDALNGKNGTGNDEESHGNGGAAASSAAAQASAQFPHLSPPATFSRGEMPVLSIALPSAFGGQTFNLNPFTNERFSLICAWHRRACEWLAIILFGFWASKQASSYIRGVNSAPQAKGNTVVAGTGGQATALIAASAITAVVLTGVVAVLSFATTNLGAGTLLSAVGIDPIDGLIGGSTWMLDQLFPLGAIVAYFSGRLIWHFAAGSAYAVAASFIRFIVP